MRVLIIGAGNTGKYLTAKLCEMGQDVVVIDPNSQAINDLAMNFDVMTIQGNGADPELLASSSIGKIDLLAAVTPHDEINLLACCWGKAAGTNYTISRLSQHKYINSPLVDFKALGVDRALVQREEVTQEVFNVLQQPGTLEMTSPLGGKITAVGIKLPDNSPLKGQALKLFRDHEWFTKVRFIGHVANNTLTIPGGNSVFNAGDDVYTVLLTEEVNPFLDWVTGGKRAGYRKAVIVGGGEFGLSLAKLLEDSSIQTILIDNNKKSAIYASEHLKNCLVLNADATLDSTLREAGVDSRTAFIAITGDEELNIVTAIQAKQMGAGFTIARIDKPGYVPIIANLKLVDSVISPNNTIIRTIIEHVRGETVEDVGLFHHIPGEVQQVVIKEDSKGDLKNIRDIKLPRGSIIAAVQRGQKVIIPTGEHQLRKNDRLLLYSLPNTVEKIKSAF